jgi:hypothetical protein
LDSEFLQCISGLHILLLTVSIFATEPSTKAIKALSINMMNLAINHEQPLMKLPMSGQEASMELSSFEHLHLILDMA